MATLKSPSTPYRSSCGVKMGRFKAAQPDVLPTQFILPAEYEQFSARATDSQSGSLEGETMKLLSTVTMLLVVLGCGEDPAFREDISKKTNQAADATVVTDSGETDVAGVGGDGGSGDGDLGAEDGAGSADSFGSDEGGSDGLAGADGSQDAGDNNAGNGNGTNGDETLVEDGGSLDIPGTKIQRVGINFEDFTDFDFNDAVLCFEGNFKIEGTNVVSYQTQTIAAKTFSASGCDHRIDVTILHADGTEASFSYRSDSGQTLQLPFKVKSKLAVTMTTIAGSCPKTPVTMHHPTYALVKGGVCNNTGN